MEPLDQILFYTLEKTLKTYRHFAQGQFSQRGIDITIDQWLILTMVHQQPGWTQQQLASAVFKDVASVTRMIELLVGKRYLERAVHGQDRRRFTLRLTPQALALLETMQSTILTNRQLALRGIGEPQIAQLHHLLGQIITNCHAPVPLSPPSLIQIRRSTPSDPALGPLIEALDQDLLNRYGAQLSQWSAHNQLADETRVVLAYRDAQAVGCVCFKEADVDGSVEIKRMYVQPAARQGGVAQALLAALEEWAIEAGYGRAILQTAVKQPEAIALYRKCGYVQMAGYGVYATDVDSVCMEKPLLSTSRQPLESNLN